MNSRWLDLRPFEDIITEFGRSNNPTSRNVGWFLDSVELGRMSRDERLRIYSAAIVEGRTTLQHGWPLLRQTAIGAAAIDGLAELKPLIEAHYPEESAEVRSAFPLPELLVRLELGAGASDREDANRLASERLAAMKDADFRDRMNTDAAFQKVVGDIAPTCAQSIPLPHVATRLCVDQGYRQATRAARQESSPGERHGDNHLDLDHATL